MANALSKSQLAAAIAEKAEISKKQAVEILEHIATLAYKHAKDTFTLPGIGKLVLKNRAARMGRNPKTGETIRSRPSASSSSASPKPRKTPSSAASNLPDLQAGALDFSERLFCWRAGSRWSVMQ